MNENCLSQWSTSRVSMMHASPPPPNQQTEKLEFHDKAYNNSSSYSYLALKKCSKISREEKSE